MFDDAIPKAPQMTVFGLSADIPLYALQKYRIRSIAIQISSACQVNFVMLI